MMGTTCQSKTPPRTRWENTATCPPEAIEAAPCARAEPQPQTPTWHKQEMVRAPISNAPSLERRPLTKMRQRRLASAAYCARASGLSNPPLAAAISPRRSCQP